MSARPVRGASRASRVPSRPRPRPTLRPATLRRDLQRLLGRLGLADDPGAPREIAVVVALRDGVPLRDALERLGIDTAPLDLPPPPDAVPFAQVAPGTPFAWQGHVWTRATLDQALTATPERHDHPRVVAAYLAATQRGRAATAFRWAADLPACVADRVELDDPVYPTAPPEGGPLQRGEGGAAGTWVSTGDQAPDLGRDVTIDTLGGPRGARLLLDDGAAGGAAWHTTGGERLDLDEVSRWRP